MSELPTGTVTFLFTDVEGSTRMLRALGAERYSEVLADHNALLRAQFEREGGLETHHQGDSFVVVFRSAGAAVRAAIDGQRALTAHGWPHGQEVRVRMGLHTGEATIGRDGYVGFAVHQAARIGDAGHGGQILVSATTASLVERELPEDVGLRDLGGVRLQDIDRAEHLFQLAVAGLQDEFPPLLKRVADSAPTAGPPLLEREAELATLQALVQDLRLGSGRVVAIEAGAGMGKTRLLAEARRLAAGAGLAVLGARGGELEREFPFGVVRQLFEPALTDSEQREDALSGAAALAAPLFDEERFTDALDLSADTSFATLHGLYWLAANLAARRPVLLVVDDAHWCDQPSLRWLTYLARRLDGVPVLLLLAVHPVEAVGDERMLGELVTDTATTVLRPGALTDSGVQLLVRTLLTAEGDPDFVAACSRVTGGNPFLLRELLTTLAAEEVRPERQSVGRVKELGPQAASRAVRARLSRLPSEAVTLARSVAVLGDNVSLERAAAHADLDRDLAAHLAGALTRADILRSERTLTFVHPVIRAAVYQELDPADVEDAHGRAARILADEGAAPEQVAAQVLHAAPSADAQRVEVLQAAARVARGRGAPESAVTYLRRALAEPPPDALRADVLYELGSAEKLVHGPSAAQHLREALARTTDPERRVQTRIELARALFFSRQIDAGAAAFAAAIAELSESDSEPRRRALAGYLFVCLSDPAMLRSAEPHFAQAAQLDLLTSPGGRMLLAVLSYRGARCGDPRAEAVERARLALDGDALFEEEDAAFYSLPGLVLDAADLLDESEAVWDRVLDVARRRGSIFAFAAGSGFRARTRYLSGSLAEAAEDARAALDAARAHGLDTGLPYALAFLGDALIDLGALGAAAEALAQADMPDEPPMSAHFNFFLSSRGRLRMLQGQVREGLRDLEAVGRIDEALAATTPGFAAWRPFAALGYLRLGDIDRARALAERELELAREWGAARPLGVALRTAGVVEGGERGVALLRESVEVLEASPARLERARTMLELGTALSGANRRVEARERLTAALELAESCGAAPLADQARSQLSATGARVRAARPSGPDALTASERRVADMAREGLTNRQIAQALFVTPKTVEVHLSSVYRKLGISSRNDLARALAPREPVAPTA